MDERIQPLYWNRDFSSLDRLAGELRTSRARTASGVWKLTHFYSQFEKFAASGARGGYPDGLHWKYVEEWRQQSPDSAAAIIVNAILLLSQSQKKLDRMFDKSDSGQKSSHVIDFVEAAKIVLEDNESVASSDPHWHALMLRIMGLQRVYEEEFLIARSRAAEEHPDYHESQFQAIDQMIWRSYPDSRRIEGLANTIAVESRGEGIALYARLFDHVAKWGDVDDLKYLTAFDWEKVRKGFEKIVADYPTNWNKQHFAFYSCIMGDRLSAEKQFAEIKQAALVREAWRTPEIRRQCVNWIERK